MPDYASILKRSIETLPEKTPELRQAVYERARTALARQLISVDPPLNPEAVELQHQHLEEAILAVEADLSPATESAGETPGDTDKAKSLPARDGDQMEGQETSPARAQIEAEPSSKRWEPPKVSRAPALIMVLLLALVAAGAAVFYYTQRDTISALIADPADAPASQGDVAPEIAGGGEISVPPKNEDRLPGGVVAPLDGARIIPPVAETPDAVLAGGGVSGTARHTPQTGGASGTQMALSEAPAGEMPALETPANGTPVPETAAESETVDSIPPGLVGQRAIFDEQGAEGAPGQSIDGVVAWSLLTGENGLPAIVGRIDLPDRNAAVSLTITKNTDEALPASHLIEIEFRGADGLIGSPIERIPALFAKQTARGPGELLVGEAVLVTDTLYWIALSDQGDQVRRNLALLREGAWFELPILFRDGRGGKIIFEKGIPGDQVFEAVLAAWEKADAGQ